MSKEKEYIVVAKDRQTGAETQSEYRWTKDQAQRAAEVMTNSTHVHWVREADTSRDRYK